MLRTVLLAGCLLHSMTFAVADEKSDNALKEFQGRWKAAKVVVDGQQASGQIAMKLVFTCQGNQWIPDDNPRDIATVQLDPEKKPAWIDVTDGARQTTLGLYELSGDTLKLCFGVPGSERPRELASRRGGGHFYLEMKRVPK